MKVKAPKKNKQSSIKQEKKNKIIEKEDMETFYPHNKEDLKKKEPIQKKLTQNNLLVKPQASSPKKKEAKTQKTDSTINIFTEGLSYEKIDQNQYNKALSNFNNLFMKDLNKNKKLEKKNEKPEKKGQISKKYLYERALYKGIEIEIKINKDKDKDKNKNKTIDEIMLIINNFFVNDNNFNYYEYSNSRNISFNKISEGDKLSYRHFYKNYDSINIDNNLYNSKEDYIKQLDYVNTLNNLFYKFNLNKKLFYIITPIYAFSFDYNKKIPLLLMSSKSLETQLSKNLIKIIKIKHNSNTDKDKQNKNSITKAVNVKKENTEAKTNPITDNNDKSDINEDEEDEIEINSPEGGTPIGIGKLYVGLFFNFFVNQNILKPFNIFSNYEFEGCIFRKCRTKIIPVKKNGENNNIDSIFVRIEGIIFEESIQNIIDFLKNKLEANNYIIRLNKIKSTGNFYKENKEIESSFEKVEFKDNNFYFYKQ